jgi:GNAT superfamily N-acetyltransferase
VEIVVRDAVVSDLDVLLDLYEELAEGGEARVPAGRASSQSVFATILADPTRHLCVAVATDRNQVIGAADLLTVANLTHHARPWAVIENVIVTHAARRNGAATALLRHAIGIAESEGCYKVQLHSGKQRVEAHHLYGRLGFRPVAEGFKLYFDATTV